VTYGTNLARLFVINFIVQVFVFLILLFYVTNPLSNTVEKLIQLLTVLNLAFRCLFVCVSIFTWFCCIYVVLVLNKIGYCTVKLRVNKTELNYYYTHSWTQILPTWLGNNISCTKYRNVHDLSRRKPHYSSWWLPSNKKRKRKIARLLRFLRAKIKLNKRGIVFDCLLLYTISGLKIKCR
jgi:hypothetical protein